ncbi:MAG: OPT/YSL family transporter [Candidatus Zixiibacteriota bacterium]
MSHRPEITWQSVTGAIVVSAIISMAYPYIVLKLGMGPNMSVLAAFLGAIFLSVTAMATRGRNAVQNNIIQSAATSAVSTAFMCVVAAAFGYLAMNESVDVKVSITPFEMFTWLACSGAIGVFFSAMFRRYFVDDPEMIFADGVAAAETINVLDQGGAAGPRLKILGVAALAGAIVSFLRDAIGLLANLGLAMRYRIGIEWSLLNVGTGLLIGMNVGMSMLLGTAVVWFFGPMVMEKAGMFIVQNSVAPQYWEQVQALAGSGTLDAAQTEFLQQHGGMMAGYLSGNHFSIVMLWFMWPATALMIFAALTAVLLKWRSIATMFRELRSAKAPGQERTDVSLRTIIIMSTLFTILLAVIQNLHFAMPYWQTIAAVVCGLPLILVGVRVLGETNNGPVSLMANTLQAIFRAFSPHIGHNLVAAGMSGNINSQGEGLMQVFKTGKLVGSTPRVLTWVQFWAVPIGAAAVAIMYPVLIGHYGLGGDGLAAPTGLKLANMAVLMSKGISAFPPGALLWTVIASSAGVLIALCRDRMGWRWLPSAAGFGFALILPGTLNIPIGLGALIGWIWQKYSPGTYERNYVTVASGFIGGEALIAGLILPILFYFGVF